MSIFDSLRGFLGLHPRNEMPRNHGFKNPIMNGDDEDCEDELFDDNYRHNMENNFGFNVFSGDILDMHRFFEQQFDEMLKNFQSKWFHNFTDESAGLMLPGVNDNGNGVDTPNTYDENPRSRFLKPAYVNPPTDSYIKEDTDVDNKVPLSRVLDLFPDKKDQQISPNPHRKDEQIVPHSSKIQRMFTSQSIRKRVLPHGGVEEERKCIKNGQEEVQLSRQLGNMKHVITTVKLPDGTVENHEEFVNMDEAKLSDFNKAWGSTSSSTGNFSSTDIAIDMPFPDLFDIFRKFMP